MADSTPSAEEVAKELTLKALDDHGKTLSGNVLQDAENLGTYVGSLYTTILKSVRAAHKVG